MFSKQHLSAVDPAIWAAIGAEFEREEMNLELIASENYASPAVLAAQASVLTNKYAEGYPGRRYYGGCFAVDQVETLAIERVKKLFAAPYANVQPHSGSQANAAVYFGLLKPGDTILGMSLAHGGHLTHGASVSISGKVFEAVPYGVRKDDELIDYAEVARLAEEHRPKMIIAGASSYARVIDWQKFRAIADEVGAYLMVDMAHYAGLIAAGEYPNPVGIADIVTSTTHKTLRGPRGGFILAESRFEKPLAQTVFPGMQGGPLMHVIAAKAVAFQEALSDDFKSYARQVIANARAMAKALSERDLRICTGGTDSHMFLVDLRSKGITGKVAEAVLEEAGITVNKNAIPFDPEKPMVTSGIRIGTPALTTRGFREKEATEVAHLIADVLDAIDSDVTKKRVRDKVTALCKTFPVYHEMPLLQRA